MVWCSIQGNSRKGFGRCRRLSCLLHYIHFTSLPLHTNSWDDISWTLFVNSPVYQIYIIFNVWIHYHPRVNPFCSARSFFFNLNHVGNTLFPFLKKCGIFPSQADIELIMLISKVGMIITCFVYYVWIYRNRILSIKKNVWLVSRTIAFA